MKETAIPHDAAAWVGLSELQQRAVSVVRDAVAPRAAEIDRTAAYPTDIYERFRDEGFLSLSLPVELGGSGLGVRALTMVTEEASKFSSVAGLILLLSRLPAAPILIGGTPDQQRRYLVPLGRGESRGALGMSEPRAGSDVLGQHARAEKVTSGWRIAARKAWISGADEADWFVVTATEEGRRPGRGMRAFVVDADLPGVEIIARHDRPGSRGMSLCDVNFDVTVPDDQVLPGVQGVAGILGALATMRPVVSARGTGLAAAALMLAVERIEGRTAGGQPLSDRQGLQWQVAEVATRLEAARLLMWRAAELVDSGRSGPDVAGQLAMAKLSSSEVAVQAAALAAQLHGAEGTLSGTSVDRLVRDARLLTIIEGTSEIQRTIIARSIIDRSLWWAALESPVETTSPTSIDGGSGTSNGASS